MTEEDLYLIRDWVRAEIELIIAGYQEDEEGYRCSVHEERKEADRLYSEIMMRLLNKEAL